MLLALPQVASVRGSGLILGVQLVDGIDAPAVYRRLIELGMICNAVNASTLRLLPPLTVSDDELVEAGGLIGTALEEATG
jgi:acetylornithine/succinyldiaminopimelate/putrescine aminotransferase